MSDVQINNSWTTLPDSDKAYQSTLSLYAYADNDILCGLQQTPPSSGVVTSDGFTTYLQSTTLQNGYNGKWIKSTTTTNDNANMTTIIYYMSNTSNGYDISNTRCYIQFTNTYGLPISSWVLLTDNDVVIASGNSIASDETLEINFLNDYDTINFKFKLTLSSTPSSTGHWLYVPYGDSTLPLNPDAYNYGASDGLYHIHCDIPNGIFITYSRVSGGAFVFYIATLETSAPVDTSITAIKIAYYTYYSTVTWSGIMGNYSATSSSGYIYRSNGFSDSSQLGDFLKDCLTYNGYFGYTSASDAASYLYGMSFGYNTALLNDYVGVLLECNMFADVSQTSPGPMAVVSEGGFNGDFDNSTYVVSIPALPYEPTYTSPSYGDLYLLNETTLAAFKNEIFSANVITQIMRGFTDVTNSIITMNLYPLPSAAYARKGTSNIYCAGIDLGSTTETYVINRYISYDLGTVDLNLYWDSALDLNPYTQLSIYLPGIGVRPIDADICMGHTLNCTYQIDLLTGNAMAYVSIDGSAVYQWPGNLAERIAISGNDWGRTYEAILTTLSGAAQSAITGGGSALAGVAVASAAALQASKIHRETVGSVGGSFSRMGVMYPYIIIDRPIQNLPRNYRNFRAYPSHMTALLSDISGYSEIEEIRLDDVICTDNERAELDKLLKSGVYF